MAIQSTGSLSDSEKPSSFQFGVWYPIKTAPAGTAVLIAGGTYYSDQGWDTPPGDPFAGVTIAWRRDRDEYWQGNQLAHDEYLWHKPTHWMPLPSPPGAELNFSDEAGSDPVSMMEIPSSDLKGE